MIINNPENNRFLRAQDNQDIYYYHATLTGWDMNANPIWFWVLPDWPVGAIPVGISATLYDDNGFAYTPPFIDGQGTNNHMTIISHDSGNIAVERRTGGPCDAVLFDSIVVTRLEVLLTYYIP